MDFKTKIHQHYRQAVAAKIAAIQRVLDDLKESGANETKSTAGDKHETALATIQIEQAQVRKQMHEVLDQQAIVEKIKPEIRTASVVSGSLLKTSQGWFFISAALGKAQVDGQTVMALSPQSPLGRQFMGRRAGDLIEMNQYRYLIENIE